MGNEYYLLIPHSSATHTLRIRAADTQVLQWGAWSQPITFGRCPDTLREDPQWPASVPEPQQDTQKPEFCTWPPVTLFPWHLVAANDLDPSDCQRQGQAGTLLKVPCPQVGRVNHSQPQLTALAMLGVRSRQSRRQNWVCLLLLRSEVSQEPNEQQTGQDAACPCPRCRVRHLHSVLPPCPPCFFPPNTFTILPALHTRSPATQRRDCYIAVHVGFPQPRRSAVLRALKGQLGTARR